MLDSRPGVNKTFVFQGVNGQVV